MTKTNKTLLCVLLALVMTFALALTALTVADTQTAKAEGETLVATFNCGDNGDASHNDGSSATTYEEENGNYTLTITGTNMSTKATDEQGNGALKLGISKKAGDISFTAPSDVVLVKIYVAQYKTNELSVKVNDGTAITISTASDNGEYTAVEADTSTTKDVTLTVSSGCRAMIDKIEFYTAATVEEGTVSVKVNGSTMTVDGTDSRYFELSNHARITIDSVTLKQGEAYILTLAEGTGYAGEGVTTANYIVKVNGKEVAFDGNEASGQAAADATKLEITFACRHNATKEIVKKEATCTEAGYEASWECDECGTLFDSAEKTNVIEAATVIPTLGHNYVNGVCSRCGNEKEVVSEYAISIDEITKTISYHNSTEPVKLSSYELNVKYNQLMKGSSSSIQLAKSEGWLLIESVKIASITIVMQTNSVDVYRANYVTGEIGEKIYTADSTTATYELNGEETAIMIKAGSKYAQITSIKITVDNSTACTHENARFVAEVPATCKTTGFAAHYECDEESCQGKYFVKNGETYEEKTAEDLTIDIDSSKHEYVERIGVNFKVEGEENLYYKSCKYCFAKGTETFTGFVQKITFEGASSVSSAKLSENGTFTVSYKVTANTGINALTFRIVTPEGFKVDKIELAGFLASATATEVKDGVTEYIVTVEDLGADFEYFTSEEAVLTVTYSLNGATAGAHEFTLQCVTASAIDVSTSPATHMDIAMETNTVTVKVLGTETITVEDDQSKTYDKTAATVAYSGTERVPTIVWSDDNDVLESAPVNAGVYAFVATFAATDTLEEQVFEGFFTINKREVELTITPKGTIKAYDAVELSYFTATADVADEVWELISIRPVYFTEIGENNVYITAGIKSDFANNYVLKNANEQGQVEYTVVVNVVAGEGNGWINALSTISGTKYYDGKTVQILEKIKASKGTPVVKYKLAGGEAWLDYTDGVILNAGEYTIWAYVVEDAANGIPALNDVESEATFITYTVKQIKVSDIELDYETSGEVSFLEVGLVDDDGKTVTVEGATIVYKVNGTVVTVDTLYTITATAERGTYTISVEVTGCGEGNVVLCESKTTVAIYEVKFVNGETTVSTSYVFAGQKVDKHADLEEEGMYFEGWFVGENEYKGTEEINADTVVTAKWIALYTVTFKNGETIVCTATDVFAGDKVKYEGEEVTKAKDDYFTYTFSGWVIEGTETKFDLENDTVNGNLVLVATFTSTRHSGDLVLKVFGADNQQRGETKTVIVTIGESISTHLIADENIAWHKLGAWVVEGTTEAASMIMPDQQTYSITATYVFAIGTGDVDGSGTIDTKDITLYRQVIVGGYDITTVENAWETATTEGFVYEQGKFYLAAVANVDGDEAGKTDIRDVSTIRMALVGGYGYTVDEATNSVVKGTNANTLNSARSAAPKQVLAPMGLFGKKFAL